MRLSRSLIGVLLLALPSWGSAQRMSTVTGLVFDSVSHVPVAGAAVQIASRDSANRWFSSTSDAAGRFRIGGIPSGRYVIGFYDDALTALGMDAPLRMFELKAGVNLKLDLAIPPGGVVRALHCGGEAATDGNGMLAGLVRDPLTGAAIKGATVSVHWQALTIDSSRVHNAVEGRSATANSQGAYLLCDLPGGSPLDLSVSSPGRRVVVGDILVPVAGVQRRDFHLSDSGVVNGPAIVTGKADHEGGRPVTSGRATVSALGIDVPIQNGKFVMKGLPLGTWSLDVRGIGLEPGFLLVDVLDSAGTSVAISLKDRAQPLEPVSVIGRPSRETKILRDVLFRKRFGAGTVFMPGSDYLKDADQIGDVLRGARGFHYVNPNRVSGRQPCTTNGKRLKLYINGNPFPGTLEDLNSMISINNVMAVEAYPDGMSAPPLWGMDHPCAVIAVWTWTP